MNAVFVAPGDVVVVEEPTFTGFMGRLKKCGANCIGVPADGAGIRIDALARILDDLKARGTRPRYLYTIPTIQNPTGSVMPVERRRRSAERRVGTECVSTGRSRWAPEQ